jgi:integrase
MFGPDYTAACPSCSSIADGFNGFQIHLANHDVMLCAVSRAPLAKLQAYKRRMGWTFPWASSHDHRQSAGLEVSSINRELQVLRRVLRLAVEWGAMDVAPKIRMIAGEKHRERVVTPEEEAKYLAAAPEPLASIGAVLIDTGMRPDECFRLRWESITWVNRRYGTLLVTHGKTAAARRLLPMTPRVRGILEGRWEAASKPAEGWVWVAPTRSGHIESSSLKKQHSKAFEVIAKEATKNNAKPVRPFVLYSLRHTFL